MSRPLSHVHVERDVPAGMTLVEWHRAQTATRERDTRHRSMRRREAPAES